MRSRHEWHGEREAFRRISTKNLADAEAVRPKREFRMNNWDDRETFVFINSVRSIIIKERGEKLESRNRCRPFTALRQTVSDRSE